MQAFTAQPLTKQAQSNPFADRALLAALIIPHLETYLATHPDVRFLLIEYPSEHLPTVLALQALIGAEMMKVVGIIDSDSSSPMQSLSVPDMDRRLSEGFRSLNRQGSHAFVGPCSFSKANFLLASSATGFETAAFVAAIRESLISISNYYIPERPLYKHPPQSPPRKVYRSLNSTKMSSTISAPSRKETSRVSVSTLTITPPSSPTKPSPPAQTQSHYHINPLSIPPRSSSSSALPLSRDPRPAHNLNATAATVGRIRWGDVNYVPSTPTKSTTTALTAATTTIPAGSTSSNHTPHHHRHKNSDSFTPRGSAPALARPPQQSSAAAPVPTAVRRSRPNLSIPDGCDEDSDDDDDVPDAEERRLMPLYLRRREEIERGRSSKALKWLGLA